MEFVGLLFTILSIAIGTLGVRLLLPHLRNDRFARGDSGVRTTGKCVNMRWTSGGWVSSIIAYEDADGERRFASTRARPTIPVHLGGTAEVYYDPRGQAQAVVNGEMPPKGFYAFCMVPIGVSLTFGVMGLYYLLV
ncbi:hypothetical protein F0L17_10270 [Streptomyces sp. TRM43335]|uniref:DUF3592 domain-containing protein n=1 Tax=Streptomyces taklimakanensis TaxID=2569853 RepID=A0A6G2BBR5_9ACTN|nr:DUF3592 domain-containing protein [Streptomyces taklimakanensis]MTE19503.1 hypothetical protein [Streptomyces taklimakanensis]